MERTGGGRLLRPVALVALLSATSACATARNYVDPQGPVLVGSRATDAFARGELRIVTFNLKFGEHVDAAAALLTEHGPLHRADVLVLQEMDGPGVEYLARALGMNYAYVPFTIHPATRRDMGVAVLSPWPLDEPRKVLLPVEHRIRKIRRSAVVATLHLPALSVRVYAVHLETVFGASSGQRRNQARAILDDVARWEGPAVIAGDFNGTSGAAEVAKSGFVWLTRDVHNTEWLFDLDHILVRGLCAAMDPPARKAPRAEQVSDHAPVWSVVRPCPA